MTELFNHYEILNKLNIEEENKEFKEAINKIDELDNILNDLKNQKKICENKINELNEIQNELEEKINKINKTRNFILVHFDKAIDDHLNSNSLTLNEIDNILLFIKSFYKYNFTKSYLFFMKIDENDLYKKLIELFKMMKIKKHNIPNSTPETKNNFLLKSFYQGMTNNAESIFYLRNALTQLMKKIILFTYKFTKRDSLYNIEDITTYDII